MMMKRYLLPIVSVMLATTACSKMIPSDAYQSRGGPETLLDVSSEMINISLDSDASLGELVQWLNEDQPTRVEIYCVSMDHACTEAQNIIEQFAIPYNVYMDDFNQAVLRYDRILARDCDHRYLDNPINPYNLNHPTFGCSTAMNTLQMIADKQQIVSPALSDFQDASRAEQVMQEIYYDPPENTTEFGAILQ